MLGLKQKETLPFKRNVVAEVSQSQCQTIQMGNVTREAERER